MTRLQFDVLREFRRFGIRFLVAGGQAMRAYGIDRQTRDLDLWVARDRVNAEALRRFMGRVQHLPPLERLQQPNFKFTVGDPAMPDVDILTSLAGDPPFDEAFERRRRLFIDGQPLPVVSPTDLLAIKEASAAKMESEAVDNALPELERNQAARTAAKERRDATLIQDFLAGGD